jgi:hypothetical protein
MIIFIFNKTKSMQGLLPADPNRHFATSLRDPAKKIQSLDVRRKDIASLLASRTI